MARLVNETGIFTLLFVLQLASHFMRQHIGEADDRIERRTQLVADSCEQSTFADAFRFKLRLQRIDFLNELLLTFKRTSDQRDHAIHSRTIHAE